MGSKNYLLNWLISLLFLGMVYSDLQAQNSAKTDSLQVLLVKAESEERIKLSHQLIDIWDENNQSDKIDSELSYWIKWLNANPENDLKPDVEFLIASIYHKKQEMDNSTAYLDKLIGKKLSDSKQELQAEALNLAAQIYMADSLEYAIKLAGRALETGKVHELTNITATAYNILGLCYYYKSEYEKALENFSHSLELRKQRGELSAVALLLNNMGVINRQWGEFKSAIEYYQQALEIQEELGDTLNIARSLSNIGNIYYDYGIDYNKSLEYYHQGLEFFEILGDSTYISTLLNNIGYVYKEQKRYEDVQKNIQTSLSIARLINYDQGIANALQNMVDINILQENYALAIRNLKETQKLFTELGDRLNLALNYKTMAEVYINLGQIDQALNQLNIGLTIAEDINIRNDLIDFYRVLADIYRLKGNYQRALDYYMDFSDLKDTIYREDYLKQISELQTKYETQKKEKEIALQKTQIARNALEAKRNRIIAVSIGIGFFIILVFSILLYRQYRAKQKANILLQKQNEEIKNQHDKIVEQKKAITDSIRYASKIQTALLPPYRLFDEALGDYFVFFRPKDIVSGDFYWVTQKGNATVIAAVDCTGHGVPGAFMSVLGIAFLNEIVNAAAQLTASDILNRLREHVVNSLHQTGRMGETQDGMDMTLCIIDKDNRTVQYAGAFNPLVLIRKQEVMVFEADRMPIGIYQKEKDAFKNHEIPLEADDCLYMFSDGFADQFGGPKKKKFMIRRFRELLKKISPYSMNTQRNEIEKAFDDWKGDYKQIDDVLVIGIRI